MSTLFDLPFEEPEPGPAPAATPAPAPPVRPARGGRDREPERTGVPSAGPTAAPPGHAPAGGASSAGALSAGALPGGAPANADEPRRVLTVTQLTARIRMLLEETFFE